MLLGVSEGEKAALVFSMPECAAPWNPGLRRTFRLAETDESPSRTADWTPLACVVVEPVLGGVHRTAMISCT
jgi:hypothetical protein